MKKKKKLILGIGIGIISVCIVTIVSILIFFPVYLNSSKMKKDYVESMTDDKMWKIYLIPDSLGFVRGYIIPKENHMPKEITVLTKEYGSFDKATTKMYIADDLETPAEKNILKGKKVYDFIEAESGAEEKTEIPIIIKWTNKSNQLIESKATIKYDKWNAYGWFTTLKVKLGLDVF